tara:strand:+ start:75 stop:371 length:297 start_codon:yes stop_codon:yes gene_type:complete
MHQKVNEHIFKDTIKRLRPDNFTWGGLSALFDHLEQYEDDSGTSMEFDPIALCCEYSEYEDFKEIQETYSSLDLEDLEDLHDYTTVIEHDDGIIIQDF